VGIRGVAGLHVLRRGVPKLFRRSFHRLPSCEVIRRDSVMLYSSFDSFGTRCLATSTPESTSPSAAYPQSLNNSEPVTTVRAPTKLKKVVPQLQKKTQAKPRLPYKIYSSADDIEIRVGRNAVDNDELSTNAQHRDSSDWWLHVSSHPGSHVVIRSTDDDLLLRYPATVTEAALLAVVNSKIYSPSAGRVVVTLTRCSAVHKISGAPAGQVQLYPSRLVQSVTIDVKREIHRLETLNKTRR
jgi:predicted ribosome quality control (RQC) complex YloA/Tae2 family protein